MLFFVCFLLFFFNEIIYTAHSEVIVAVVVGFAEDRMMDIITGKGATSSTSRVTAPEG